MENKKMKSENKPNGGANQKSMLKTYKWSLILAGIVVAIYLVNNDLGAAVTGSTFSNLMSMFGVLPPILILIGLLDVWVPKETMIKYMGPGSGVKGIFIALFIGSLAAGPLYAAFPVAAILMKKRARFAYVLFFLGVWSSSKVPLVLFEYTSLGGTFTAIHVISNLTLFLMGSFIIEKMVSKDKLEEVYESAGEMTSA